MQLRHSLALEPHKGVAPEAERPPALVLRAEVESASEADRAVDYDDFAVVTEIHLAAEDRQRDGHEGAAVDARILQILDERALEAPAPDRVVKQPYLDAAARSFFQQRADARAELVAAHDEKFHVDIIFRLAQSLFNRGEGLVAVDKYLDAVAHQQLRAAACVQHAPDEKLLLHVLRERRVVEAISLGRTEEPPLAQAAEVRPDDEIEHDAEDRQKDEREHPEYRAVGVLPFHKYDEGYDRGVDYSDVPRVALERKKNGIDRMREVARDAEPLFGENEKPVAPLEDGRHEAGEESDKQREKNPPSDLVHKAAAFRFAE